MRLLIETEKPAYSSGEPVTVRLLVLNDSYEPVSLDRRLLVGPNPVPEGRPPFPVSIEPSFSREEQNLIMLNPWCFYGRQRTFDSLPPGKTTVYAYLLRRPTDSLLPGEPGERDALLSAAEPLIVEVNPR
ncbi:MAG: hypothetical protein IBX68_05475 [Dehalococcoidia bacterium]|nr:hypothetical protein [Dehalococcoidia bacterium]